jgi:hypothetical protein
MPECTYFCWKARNEAMDVFDSAVKRTLFISVHLNGKGVRSLTNYLADAPRENIEMPKSIVHM